MALLERDGYVIYRSAADASNDDAQRRRWPAMVAQNGGETVSLIFEHGKVVASQTKAGFLIVHTTPEVKMVFRCQSMALGSLTTEEGF